MSYLTIPTSPYPTLPPKSCLWPALHLLDHLHHTSSLLLGSASLHKIFQFASTGPYLWSLLGSDSLHKISQFTSTGHCGCFTCCAPSMLPQPCLSKHFLKPFYSGRIADVRIRRKYFQIAILLKSLGGTFGLGSGSGLCVGRKSSVIGTWQKLWHSGAAPSPIVHCTLSSLLAKGLALRCPPSFIVITNPPFAEKFAFFNPPLNISLLTTL